MLLKYLFSKKYREDSMVALIIQSNDADKQLEKIYCDITSSLKRKNYFGKKKAS